MSSSRRARQIAFLSFVLVLAVVALAFNAAPTRAAESEDKAAAGKCPPEKNTGSEVYTYKCSWDKKEKIKDDVGNEITKICLKGKPCDTSKTKGSCTGPGSCKAICYWNEAKTKCLDTKTPDVPEKPKNTNDNPLGNVEGKDKEDTFNQQTKPSEGEGEEKKPRTWGDVAKTLPEQVSKMVRDAGWIAADYTGNVGEKVGTQSGTWDDIAQKISGWTRDTGWIAADYTGSVGATDGWANGSVLGNVVSPQSGYGYMGSSPPAYNDGYAGIDPSASYQSPLSDGAGVSGNTFGGSQASLWDTSLPPGHLPPGVAAPPPPQAPGPGYDPLSAEIPTTASPSQLPPQIDTGIDNPLWDALALDTSSLDRALGEAGITPSAGPAVPDWGLPETSAPDWSSPETAYPSQAGVPSDLVGSQLADFVNNIAPVASPFDLRTGTLPNYDFEGGGTAGLGVFAPQTAAATAYGIDARSIGSPFDFFSAPSSLAGAPSGGAQSAYDTTGLGRFASESPVPPLSDTGDAGSAGFGNGTAGNWKGETGSFKEAPASYGNGASEYTTSESPSFWRNVSSSLSRTWSRVTGYFSGWF